MPRKARVKHKEAIYHIICRSTSELLLFREDEDKDHYLALLKRYIDRYRCSIYAYCLMDNHLHIHLDPKGFDISTLMHSINTAFVRYYNMKYQRHGPLFQGRFQSKVLDSDRYNLAVSAYIHNNPKDISGYEGREEDYPYSSYGVYLRKRRDNLNLVDMSFIAGLLQTSSSNFIKKYYALVNSQRDVENIEDMKDLIDDLDVPIENEYVSGRNIILRDLPSSKVISIISNRLMIPAQPNIATKGSRRLLDYRAFCAYALRVLGGLSYREICQDMHSITISCCSRLCNRGYELLNGDDNEYMVIFNELASLAA